jgi:hypothetical protein
VTRGSRTENMQNKVVLSKLNNLLFCLREYCSRVHVFNVFRVPEHSLRRSGGILSNESLSLRDVLSTGRHLLGVSFVATLKSN